MNEASPCECVADTSALHEIASESSGNVKATLLDQLKNGVIGVPACVWKEFADLFPDEAAALADYVPSKITLAKRAYTVKAAALAEKLNSGFSRGPYDDNTDLYTASIATVEGYAVLTAKSQISAYGPMGAKVMDLSEWLAE